MNFKSVVHCLGWSLIPMAAAMLLPAMAAAFAGDGSGALSFTASAVLTGFFSGALVLSTRGMVEGFKKKEAFLFVVAIWPLLAAVGAMPLYFATSDLALLDTVFEATSGLTTTGATIMVKLEGASDAVLLWRALLQWLGGFLSVLLVLVLLSHLAVGGMEIFQNAIPSGEGSSLPERLAQTAKDLFWVYVLLTALCVALLWAAGMGGFEALAHGFSTLSTGGFSTRDGNIAAFDNLWIEIVMMVFMIVGAVNFSLHWALFQGRASVYLRNRELRYLFATIMATVILVVAWTWLGQGVAFATALRHGAFAVISALSTSGFSNSDVVWHLMLPPVLIIGLVLAGGATGSTSGGMKMLRLAILAKQTKRELARLSHPHGVVSMRFGRRRIEESAIWSVWAHFFVMVVAIAVLTVVLSLYGLSPTAALAATIATLANAGPVMTWIEPGARSYAAMPDEAKALLCLSMVLGRIEILALLTLFIPAYWRK